VELLAEDGRGKDEGQVEGLAWFDVDVHGIGCIALVIVDIKDIFPRDGWGRC
jgi:hypothetical protein